MEKLTIKLANCYGIKKMDEPLDFSKSSTVLLYAPNGVMKTSFAKTFDGLNPREEIYGDTPEVEIKEYINAADVTGTAINKDDIFVIKPYDDSYKTTDTANETLLVDETQKIKYNEISKDLLDKKKDLIIKLNRLSKVKKDDLENTLLIDFGVTNLFDLLTKEKEAEIPEGWDNIRYNDIFNKDVLDLLKNPDVSKNIDTYVDKYNELIAESPYYDKGLFNPVKADTVANTLDKESFFKSGHSVQLKGDDNPIDQESFVTKLQLAKKKISENEDLVKIEQLIIAKKPTREFQELLEKYPELIGKLKISELPNVKKNLWRSYIKKELVAVEELLICYEEAKVALLAIEKTAAGQEGLWHEVVDEFELRFPDMPFRLRIENQKGAILGTEPANIVFDFIDSQERCQTFERHKLKDIEVLSRGERRALYLLNILFEIKAMKEKGKKILFVIDDIADSFDYKNKYAIIEYLKDIASHENFKQIILTHNFDFYRTVQSRILDDQKWNNSFIVQKGEDDCVAFLKGGSKNVSNPFDKWRTQINREQKIIIACIPFARNIHEYKEGTKNSNYLLLTHLLHHKEKTQYSFEDGKIEFEIEKTEDITLADLASVLITVLKDIDFSSFDTGKSVIKIMKEEADIISQSNESGELILEDKVILSIMIRIIAEAYMFSRVTDKTPLTGNQTGKLFDRFKKEIKTGNFTDDNVKLIERVNIMTPENIHLNSFMYEPILDMSISELRKLYNDVVAKLS